MVVYYVIYLLISYKLVENTSDDAVKLFLKHNLEISSLLNVMLCGFFHLILINIA
jgi:hypothetical protein